MKGKFTRPAFTACLIIYAAPAVAQDRTDAQRTDPQSSDYASGVEEIVVTAQRRSENLQKTPISLTALTSDALQSAGIASLADLGQHTPAATITPYPSSTTTLVTFIRGQGTIDPMVVTQDGAVGIYLDGVYLSRPQTASFDLADVKRVEILRGPQGTLYGRNTTGGAVNIITRKPTGELGLDGTVDVGRFGYNREFLNLNLPSAGNVSAKVTLLHSSDNGYATNIGKRTRTPQANNFNASSNAGARLSLLWKPAANITVDYSGDYSYSKSTPVLYVNSAVVSLIPGYTGDAYRSYRPFYLPESPSKTTGHAITVTWDASPELTLRSISSYRYLDFASIGDYGEAFFVPYLERHEIISDSWSQELQAVGSLADKRIAYVVGAFYFGERVKHNRQYDIVPNPAWFGGANDSEVLQNAQINARAKSFAVYGQFTVTPPILENRLRVTLGGRFTHDDRSAIRYTDDLFFSAAPGTSISPLANRLFLGAGTYIRLGPQTARFSGRWNRFNPALTLDFQASENIFLYAKYATGYKAGGTSETGARFEKAFGPESAKNYELGIKSDLLDRRIRLNLAGFISKYKDLQVIFQLDPSNPGVSDTINAGEATVKGIEAELTFRPVHALNINISYTYLNQSIKLMAPAGTIFDPAVNPAAPIRVGGDISGYFKIPFTPKNSIAAGASWTAMTFDKGDVTLFANYAYHGKMVTTAGAGPLALGSDFQARPAYDTLDARITYRHELSKGHEVSISVWGKNILDNRYFNDFVIANGGVLTGYSSQAVSYAKPATYGVQVGIRM